MFTFLKPRWAEFSVTGNQEVLTNTAASLKAIFMPENVDIRKIEGSEQKSFWKQKGSC